MASGWRNWFRRKSTETEIINPLARLGKPLMESTSDEIDDGAGIGTGDSTRKTETTSVDIPKENKDDLLNEKLRIFAEQLFDPESGIRMGDYPRSAELLGIIARYNANMVFGGVDLGGRRIIKKKTDDDLYEILIDFYNHLHSSTSRKRRRKSRKKIKKRRKGKKTKKNRKEKTRRKRRSN